MLGLIVLVLTLVGAIAGYRWTRRFVREKLRYVDASQSRIAPWLAGAGAALLTVPVAALLPGFGAGSAIAVAASIGFGVARGAKDIRVEERRLAPWG